MNAVDAEVIRNIHREINRRPIDATRIDIQVVNGRVTIGGTVTRLRAQPGVDLQFELNALHKFITKDRLVKEVFMQVRAIEEHKEDEDSDTRGRMRNT